MLGVFAEFEREGYSIEESWIAEQVAEGVTLGDVPGIIAAWRDEEAKEEQWARKRRAERTGTPSR